VPQAGEGLAGSGILPHRDILLLGLTCARSEQFFLIPSPNR